MYRITLWYGDDGRTLEDNIETYEEAMEKARYHIDNEYAYTTKRELERKHHRIEMTEIVDNKCVDLWMFVLTADRYAIRFRETGDTIDYVDSIGEADEIIAMYEAEDIDEGNYTDDCYEIYDRALDEIIL